MFAVVLRSDDGDTLTLATTPDDITDIVSEIADTSAVITGHAAALALRSRIVGDALDVGLDIQGGDHELTFADFLSTRHTEFTALAVVNSESDETFWLHSCEQFRKGGGYTGEVPRDYHGRWTKGPGGPFAPPQHPGVSSEIPDLGGLGAPAPSLPAGAKPLDIAHLPSPQTGFFPGVSAEATVEAMKILHPRVNIELHDRGDHWELSRIEVQKGHRNEGKGTKALRDLTAAADIAGIPITVTPEPIGGGKASKRLRQFYEDQGFVRNKGKNKLWSSTNSYIRYPGMHAVGLAVWADLAVRLEDFKITLEQGRAAIAARGGVPRDYHGKWCKGAQCQVVPLTSENTVADLKAGPVSAAQAAEARGLIADALAAAHTEDERAAVLSSLDSAGSASTVAQHDRLLTPSGYTAERDRQHKEIVDEFFAANADVPKEGRAVMSGGLPGAGKSTALGKEEVGIKKSEYMNIDPDEIKQTMLDRNMIERVPGMTDGEHAALLHEESGHIVDLITARATAEHRNVILDKTMGKPLNQELAMMHKAGYSVTGVYVNIPVDESMYSAHQRWVRGGRFIPPPIIEKQRGPHGEAKNVQVFRDMSAGFDEWIYVDNTGLGTPAMNPRGTVKRGSGQVTNQFAHARMTVFRSRNDTPRDYHGRWTAGAAGVATHPADAGSLADEVAAGHKVTVAPDMAVPVLESLGQSTEPVDLTKLTIAGHPDLYGSVAENQLSRSAMPQIPTAKLDDFGDYLGQHGVSTKIVKRDPADLRATQNELDGRKVGQMVTAMRNGTMVGADHPYWVSSDSRILDGHHRWAAESALSVGEKQRSVTTVQASVPMTHLLGLARTFNMQEGIQSKRHGMTVSQRVQFTSAAETTPRDYHGRWTKHGSGDMPSAGDFAQMEKIGGPLGSNGGQWYKDSDGQKYLVKPAGSRTHAENELAAGMTYEHLGVPVNGTGIFEKDGQWYVSKRAVDGHIVGTNPDEAFQMQARQGFGADTLTSSWDTFGLVGDNTLIGSDGNIYRIDVGGSNMFRAQGGPKDSFNPGREWVEPTSMRTSNQGRKLYGNMSDREAASQLSKLQDMNLDALDAQFKAAGISDAVRTRTIATYRDRIENQLPGILTRLRAGSMAVMPTEFGRDVPRDWHGRWTRHGTPAHSSAVSPDQPGDQPPGTTGRWFPGFDPLEEVPGGAPAAPKKVKPPLPVTKPKGSGKRDAGREWEFLDGQPNPKYGQYKKPPAPTTKPNLKNPMSDVIKSRIKAGEIHPKTHQEVLDERKVKP